MSGNLALNKPAYASDFLSPFAAQKAVDGNLAPIKRWVSSAMPCWMSVDLAEMYWIERWVVKHMGSIGWSTQYNMKNYKLQGSVDNITWFDIDSVTNNTVNVTDRSFAQNPRNVRFVRVYVSNGLTTNQGVASIAELEIYESPYSPYLTSLTTSSGTLNPAFNKKTFSYTEKVANNVSNITVTPTAENINAVIKVNGQTVQSGHTSEQINLQVGENTITVEVSIGAITQPYTIKVTRESSAAYLSNLILKALGSTIALNPSFNETTFNYTASVPNMYSSATVTPTAKDGTSTIKVNGETVQSGQESQVINLNVGSNTITTEVYPEGSSNPTTYTITVTRAS